MAEARVQAADFDPGAELARLQTITQGAGALASFIGLVRSDATHPIDSMTLEHYPAMTEQAVTRIAQDAEQRFHLLACTVIHRYGRLLPGERIVFVGTAASHRRAAFQAADFLMDWLKTKAPFWKSETLPDGTKTWVQARSTDDTAAARWGS